MQYTTHSQTGTAAQLPICDETPTVTYSPVVLPSPKRLAALQLKVSAPSVGDSLPIVLLSHGHGPSAWLPSLHGYTPVSNFLAGHGFVVLQPTHLNTRTITVKHEEGHELGWDTRPHDMVQILDELDTIEATVPGLKGRLDRSKIAIVGHSFGSMTAGFLLGSTNTDPRNGTKVQVHDKRIKAGVVLGSVGAAEGLTEGGRKMLPFLNIDFSTMTTPALIACGEHDQSPWSSTGPEWHADPYTLSPGPKDLLWVKDGKHGFGGLAGWDTAESDDGSPERLTFVLRMVWAYLKTQLDGDDSWAKACKALADLKNLGHVESKN